MSETQGEWGQGLDEALCSALGSELGKDSLGYE